VINNFFILTPFFIVEQNKNLLKFKTSGCFRLLGEKQRFNHVIQDLVLKANVTGYI
jgi:hypothetical protein